MDTVRRRRFLRFLSCSFPGPGAAMVTEPFAEKHHLHTGDVLHIPLGEKTAALTIAGVYYDYSSDRGTVLVDRATLLKYLPEQPVTNIAVYVVPGADAAKMPASITVRSADSIRLVIRRKLARSMVLLSMTTVCS